MAESIDGRRVAGQLEGVFHPRREKGQLLVNREAFSIDSLVKQGAFSIGLSGASCFPRSQRRSLRQLSGCRREMMETAGCLTKKACFLIADGKQAEIDHALVNGTAFSIAAAAIDHAMIKEAAFSITNAAPHSLDGQPGSAFRFCPPKQLLQSVMQCESGTHS